MYYHRLLNHDFGSKGASLALKRPDYAATNSLPASRTESTLPDSSNRPTRTRRAPIKLNDL